MKKFYIILAAAVVLCILSIFAANSSKEPNLTKRENLQVCQFSLDHYTGTIEGGRTSHVITRLNCAQTADVTATVFVYIDGELVASELYTIRAGKQSSLSASIKVPAGNNGKKYTLKVE